MTQCRPKNSISIAELNMNQPSEMTLNTDSLSVKYNALIENPHAAEAFPRTLMPRLGTRAADAEA
jgi:hypothetical protein